MHVREREATCLGDASIMDPAEREANTCQVGNTESTLTNTGPDLVIFFFLNI